MSFDGPKRHSVVLGIDPDAAVLTCNCAKCCGRLRLTRRTVVRHLRLYPVAPIADSEAGAGGDDADPEINPICSRF